MIYSTLSLADSFEESFDHLPDLSDKEEENENSQDEDIEMCLEPQSDSQEQQSRSTVSDRTPCPLLAFIISNSEYGTVS